MSLSATFDQAGIHDPGLAWGGILSGSAERFKLSSAWPRNARTVFAPKHDTFKSILHRSGEFRVLGHCDTDQV